MDDIFTNREIAIIIWIALITTYALFRKQVRNSFLNIIKSLLNIKILLYIFLYLFYFHLILHYLGWWDINNLKDIIIWFMFSGLPIGVFVATNKLKSGYWKSIVLDNLKLVVLVEFIISSFTFSLIAELFLVPIITLIVAVNTFSGHYKEYKPAEKLTSNIMSFFGLFILIYSLYRTINEIHSIGNISTLKAFLLPIVCSIISVPYMYVFKLIVEYENLFIRLKFGRKRSRELDLLIKLRLLLFCNVQVKKLQIASDMSNYNLMSISSKDEIDVAIRSYKNALLRGSTKSEIAQTRPTWITIKTPQELTSANTSSFETTIHFSDNKKEELVRYMTELYHAKEAEVIFIPPSNTSSNSLLSIDYYIDTTPTKTVLNNNIANIVILSESLAEESGISNPNVSVCAKMMDGTPLGIGNYYSSTGKAFIDVSDCPEVEVLPL
ncbi:hypothetical protein [Methanosarcina sp.]|uniref:hypothetical protein n=1 Tax=Methanosarcina sp. TaxID=2213 RepID=UPI003C71B4FB